MAKTVRITAAAAAILACCGCAEHPRLGIARTGMLPPVGVSYAAVDRDPTGAIDALSACLTARGFVAQSTTPTYLMFVTESERPGAVGAAADEPKDGGKTWLPGAAPGRTPVRTLTLTLVRASTGEEVFRIVVGEQYRPGRRRKAPIDLAAAACANLAPQV